MDCTGGMAIVCIAHRCNMAGALQCGRTDAQTPATIAYKDRRYRLDRAGYKTFPWDKTEAKYRPRKRQGHPKGRMLPCARDRVLQRNSDRVTVTSDTMRII